VGKGLTEREERGRRKVRWGEAREKGASRRGAGQSQWKDQTSDSRWFQRQHGLLRGWKEGGLRAGPGKGAHPDGEGMTQWDYMTGFGELGDAWVLEERQVLSLG